MVFRYSLLGIIIIFFVFFCISYMIFCNFESVTLITQQSAFTFSIIITLDFLGCYAWRESQRKGLVAPWRNRQNTDIRDDGTRQFTRCLDSHTHARCLHL